MITLTQRDKKKVMRMDNGFKTPIITIGHQNDIKGLMYEYLTTRSSKYVKCININNTSIYIYNNKVHTDDTIILKYDVEGKVLIAYESELLTDAFLNDLMSQFIPETQLVKSNRTNLIRKFHISTFDMNTTTVSRYLKAAIELL